MCRHVNNQIKSVSLLEYMGVTYIAPLLSVYDKKNVIDEFEGHLKTLERRNVVS